VPAAAVEIPVPPDLGFRGRPFFMDLTGTWQLVEWTAAERHPRGPDAVGRLIYSGDGFMSAFLAGADGFSDALAYSGTWEMLGRKEVVHHVSISTVEAFVGTDLVRAVSWDGDDLVLTTPPRDGWVNVLRWRRADG
jgi:Lipocalin-like domain